MIRSATPTKIIGTLMMISSVAILALFTSTADAVNMLRSNNEDDQSQHHHRRRRLADDSNGMHCGCVECDYNAWHTIAVDSSGAYTCGERIAWLVFAQGMSEYDACTTVGETDFPSECGKCSPVQCTPRSQPRCGCAKCDDIWNADAGDHTCGARITWLQTSKKLAQTLTEEEACRAVGGTQ